MGSGGHFKVLFGMKDSLAYSHYTISILRSKSLKLSALPGCRLLCLSHKNTVYMLQVTRAFASSEGQNVHKELGKLRKKKRNTKITSFNLCASCYFVFLIEAFAGTADVNGLTL